MININEKERNVVISILEKHLPNGEVWAFGSRCNGTAKDYSDLDLVIVSISKLGFNLLGEIVEAFQESELPFRVDVLDWHSISEEFRHIIKKRYDVIWQSKSKDENILAGGIMTYISRIDIHIHTRDFSVCSNIDLEEGIKSAKAAGLDAICITDHDTLGWQGREKYYVEKYELPLIVGAEILTRDGDLLVFGVKSLRERLVYCSAQEVVDWVNSEGGCAVAAHPFRNNGRGLGEMIRKVKGLAGVEVLNGNTDDRANGEAAKLAKQLRLPMLGGSDSHNIAQIGKYFTQLESENGKIRSCQDFLTALKNGRCKALAR